MATTGVKNDLRVSEYLEKELNHLNRNADLSTLLSDAGWRNRRGIGADQQVWAKGSDEVFISFNRSFHKGFGTPKWSWREAKDSERVAKHPYKLAVLIIANRLDGSGRPVPEYYEAKAARDILRDNLATQGVDMRSEFRQYHKEIEWLETKGHNFPQKGVDIKNFEAENENQVNLPVDPAFKKQGSSVTLGDLRDFVETKVSLFQYAVYLGFQPKEFKREANIPNDIVYDVKRNANIELIARNHIPGLTKVSDTEYSVKMEGKQHAAVINVSENRFFDPNSGAEGGPLEMLIALNKMEFKEAVKLMARDQGIALPEMNVSAMNVHYVNEKKQSIRIFRDEGTGRYTFYEHDSNKRGSIVDLAQDLMSSGKGVQVNEKTAVSEVVRYALKKMDGDDHQVLASMVEKYKQAREQGKAQSLVADQVQHMVMQNVTGLVPGAF